MPDDRTAAARSTAYANIEIGQARQAREAADALFRPKSPAAPAATPAAPSDLATPTNLANAPPPRVPRVLTVAAPAEIAVTPTPKQVMASPAPASAEIVPLRATPISAADHRRIRALAFYGQTIGQIARDYGVAEAIIAPIVMRHELAGANR